MGRSHHDLEAFFSPHGIVVIGASRDPTKLGYGVARNLVHGDYPGAVHLVNPAGGDLFDRSLYAAVSDVPDPVDLAVAVIPAPEVAAAVRECGERGIRAIVIASSGFGETGPAGAQLEEACLEAARRYGMRLLGPNCIGIVDTHTGLDTTFLPPPGPTKGEIAFVSHSGAMCAAVIDWSAGQGFGLSRLVSLGNQADLTETDVLEAVAGDPHTAVITLYLEGIRDGRKFVQTARQIAKPMIALKVGRSDGGRAAVASHTGALAGHDEAYTAAFRRAGILRADTTEQVFEWARTLAWMPPPAGRRIAVLTNAGGPGVSATDAVEQHGMVLADLGEDTRKRLTDLLPAAAQVANPVDMLASASPSHFAECLRLLLADQAVDGVLVVCPPPPMFAAEDVAEAIIPVARDSTKPVVVALMGDRLIDEAARRLRSARLPEFRFPERAAAALAVLVRRVEDLARAGDDPVLPEIITPAGTLLDEAAPGWMSPVAASELLAAFGIPVLPTVGASTAAEAVVAARSLGFPVVVKVDSPDILHKSDAGGVRGGLADETAVRNAFEGVVAQAKASQPDARITGVILQPLTAPGPEVIIGAVVDPQFGPLVMFGSGGVEVEATSDVEFALAPLTQSDLEHLLDATQAGRRLAGFRGRPAADRRAVEDAVKRLAALVADQPRIAEIEINPLRVFEAGGGAAAIDVRVRLT